MIFKELDKVLELWIKLRDQMFNTRELGRVPSTGVFTLYTSSV